MLKVTENYLKNFGKFWRNSGQFSEDLDKITGKIPGCIQLCLEILGTSSRKQRANYTRVFNLSRAPPHNMSFALPLNVSLVSPLNRSVGFSLNFSPLTRYLCQLVVIFILHYDLICKFVYACSTNLSRMDPEPPIRRAIF